MNNPIQGSVCILLGLLMASCASTGVKFVPVQNPRASYLGITVDAPGTEGWVVAEKRYKAGWRIMYQHTNRGDPSRTSFLRFKADRYDPGGFARAHGSLQELGQSVLKEIRDESRDQRFQEKWGEVVREDIQGREAYRLRIAWEERQNPRYPNTVLFLEVTQLLVLHSANPDEIISIQASTRRQLGQEPLSADTLLTSFVRSMRFE